MTNVNVYDIEAELLNKVADANDTTVAEIVEALCEYMEEVKQENGWE